jgi:hypothetical protein
MKTPKSRAPVVRGAFVFVAILLLWHLLASFLWIAPYSATARSVVPGNLLSQYMLPFFGQSWSVFAPEPINGDYTLKVRATVRDDEGERTTKWVDATQVELSMVQYNLFPPRAGIQSSEVASTFKDTWDALSADHRVIVGLNYYKGEDWVERLDEKLRSYGEEGTEGSGVDVVAPYLAAERMTLAYATQVAEAMWGDAVDTVQFEVYRQNIVPFEDRHNPDAERPPKQIAEVGWRAPIVLPGQSTSAFSDVFRSAYERTRE